MEGFVVTMHEGTSETGSPIPRLSGRGMEHTVCASRVHCSNKTRQIVFNHDYNMAFFISPMNVSILPELQGSKIHGTNMGPTWVLSAPCWLHEPCYQGCFMLSSRCYFTWCPLTINDGNCHLTIPIVKGCCANDMPPHTFNMRVYKCSKNNSTTMKYIYNKSES